MCVMQTRLTAREQRVASREQTIHHVDAESASQVAEAQAAAAAAYSHARRDLQLEFTAQKEALVRERQMLEGDRYLPCLPYLCCRLSLTIACLQQALQLMQGPYAAVKAGISAVTAILRDDPCLLFLWNW